MRWVAEHGIEQRTEEEEEEDAVIMEQAENGGLGEGQACWITRLALIIPLLTWI